MFCSSSSRTASGGLLPVEDSLHGVLALVQELGPVEIPVDVQVALPELALDFQAVTKELVVLTQGVAPACQGILKMFDMRRHQPFAALCQGDPDRAHWMECAVKCGMYPYDAGRDWWWDAGQPDYHGWCLICRKRGNDPSTGALIYVDHGKSYKHKEKVQACTNSNKYALGRFKANVAWCIDSQQEEARLRARGSRW